MTMDAKNRAYIWSADSSARYKNFIHTTADTEEVWMIGTADGELLLENGSGAYLCVWPQKEFAERYQSEFLPNADSDVFSVELDTFLQQLSHLTVSLAVFPTGQEDSFTEASVLLEDLNEELEQY